jgi:hypothetical protein
VLLWVIDLVKVERDSLSEVAQGFVDRTALAGDVDLKALRPRTSPPPDVRRRSGSDGYPRPPLWHLERRSVLVPRKRRTPPRAQWQAFCSRPSAPTVAGCDTTTPGS